MANNYENFGFNQNVLRASGFLGFPEGSNDLPVIPQPTVQQNYESRNSLFMSNSSKNQGFRERYDGVTTIPIQEGQNEPLIGGSDGILTGFDDITITYPTGQPNSIGGNDSRCNSSAFTFPQSRQDSVPSVPRSFEIWGGINHTGSSYDRFNNHGSTSNTSRNLSRSAKKVNSSSSGRRCIKRVRFRFVPWSNEENIVMDQELLKCTFLPVEKIAVKIAKLLPKKSFRDVIMRIQSLIKHGKIDDIWGWVEPSPGKDWSDLDFYLPNNPNDPDYLVVQNLFHPRPIKHNRV